MKTKSLLLSAFVAMMGFVACDVLEPEQTPVENGEPKTFTVHLGVSGEINATYNPLTRFTPDERDLYAIQVYHKPSSQSSYEPFAYGLFDNLENAKLELTENYDYLFKVIMVDDAKDKIYSDSILVDSNYYLGYDKPFRAKNNYNGTNSAESITKLTNEFTVSSGSYFASNSYFGSPVSYKLKDGKEYSHPTNLDVYYGATGTYTPTEDNAQISIYLKRMNYGLKIVAGDFFNNGTIKVSTSYKGYTLTPDNKSVEDVFAHYGLSSWYGYDDLSKAYTTCTLDFTWTKDDGTKVNWEQISVYCYRLKQTVVNLDYYSDGAAGSASLVMHYKDTPIEENYNEIIHGSDQDDYDW